jgi:N utilization substance protein A
VKLGIWERAILALHQTFLKYMRHDNTNLYKQFKDLEKIYTAEVHHVRPRVVILDDEGNEIVLPENKSI